MKKVFLISVLLIGTLLSAILCAPASGAVIAMGGIVAFPKGASNSELENYAKNFSSWNGDELIDTYDDDEDYTGYDDDILDFGGPGKSFIDGLQVDRVFTMRLVNLLSTDETVILLPGYNWTPGLTGTDTARNSVSGNIVVDGNIKTVSTNNLTGAGTPSTIKGFLSYIMSNPTQCYMIRISTDSSHTENLDEQIIWGELTPFADGGFKPLPIQNAVLPSNLNQKIALIPTPNLKLSNTIQMSLKILAGASVSVSFYCGATASLSKALDTRMRMAQRTIAKVQGKQQLQMLAGKG